MSAAEVLTGEVVDTFTEDEARAHVDRMRSSLAIAAEHVVEAWNRRIWTTLGYRTWEDFLDAEFGEFELPKAQKHVLMVGLRNAGMSKRAIARTTGLSRDTVDRHLAQIRPPDEVTGNDGKTYPATQPERDRAGGAENGNASVAGVGDSTSSPDTSGGHPPAPPFDPGESDDREASGGTSNPDSSPGPTITAETQAALDAIDPEGAAEIELASFLAAVAKEIHRVHAGLLTLDPERVALATDTADDVRNGLRLLRDGLTRWFDAIEEARPKPFTVINGGAQ